MYCCAVRVGEEQLRDEYRRLVERELCGRDVWCVCVSCDPV